METRINENWELIRLLEDRDTLEATIDLLNDNLRALEAEGYSDGDDVYDQIDNTLNEAYNELMYIERSIEDYAI
jgi:hypothetical protein